MRDLASLLTAAAARPAESAAPEFVATLLDEAARRGASDAYLEPGDGIYRVRYRVDGVFQDVDGVPLELAERAIARLKVLARLVVYRKETPQEGHFVHNSEDGEKADGDCPSPASGSGKCPQDVRASFFPTVRGERVVCRFFERADERRSLEELGLGDSVLAEVKATLGRPQGLFIVAGPAGSGKTTTLYACLAHLLATRGTFANLVSVEDPVERLLAGVHQTAIHPAQGMTYPVALRSLLRQDPEILLLGEIRDAETAAIAVEAGLTGHLVLTSLHAADAPDAFLRLVSLGVEPFMAASAVSAVLVLRLVRLLCRDCRVPTAPAGPWTAAGCERCGHTGYRGRAPLAEFLPCSADTAQALREGLASRELAAKLAERRTSTLQTHGRARLAAGETTASELARVLGTLA